MKTITTKVKPKAQRSSFSRNFYVWLRNLHLYFGLFVSPFVVVFSVSTILLNHGWKANGRVTASTPEVPIKIDEDLSNRELAQSIIQQLHLSGEFGMRRFPDENRLTVNVSRPGQTITVNVDLEKQVARTDVKDMGYLDASRFLHIMPGPHKVKGPDWFYTRAWGWMADTTVYLLLFISVSGIYMWAVIKAERKAGLIMLGSGAVTFIGMFLALVYL
jgi:hypothetical protein